MGTRLTPPGTPDTTQPEMHDPIAGDHYDDDGQAIDDYLKAGYEGPPEQVQGIPAPALPRVPVQTKMITRSVPIADAASFFDPVQLIPADIRRTKLIIQADIDIRIGSDKTDVYGGAAFVVTTNKNNQLDLSGHTGAVWVWAVVGGSLPAAASYAHIWTVTS